MTGPVLEVGARVIHERAVQRAGYRAGSEDLIRIRTPATIIDPDARPGGIVRIRTDDGEIRDCLSESLIAVVVSGAPICGGVGTCVSAGVARASDGWRCVECGLRVRP